MPITGSNISPSKTCLTNPFYISAAKMSTILRTFFVIDCPGSCQNDIGAEKDEMTTVLFLFISIIET